MRCLARFQKTYYYAPYEEVVPIYDDYGNETGEYETVFTKPVPFKASISAARGLAETLQFGETLVYDKTLVMEKLPYGFNEYSRLWIETKPQLDGAGNLIKNAKGEYLTTHDYEVSKIAQGSEYVSVAIAKVKVR